MEVKEKNHHIVMLPFMAQGHLIPFLALANKINRSYPIKITIATTPLNARYLKSTISSNSAQRNIHVHELPFDSREHNLPPNTENTEALSLNQMVNLFHASTSLQTPFTQLIQTILIKDGTAPLCIISDLFMGWATEVAKSCSTKNITFTTGGAYGTAAYISIWQNLPHHHGDTNNNDGHFRLPGFPETSIFHVTQLHHFLRNADGTDSWSRFFQPQIANSLNSSGWLCNTAEEIERSGLDVLEKYSRLPVWCIGPLLPPKMVNSIRERQRGVIGQHTGRRPGVSPEKCIQWLDSHSEKSVLYISFGSQNTISASQMMALATGLEDSQTPFVWVIRPPVGFTSKGGFKPEWLPLGFEERMGQNNQGLVVHGWAPQLEILCHASTGAFLSHCGWNSTMESLSQGVPIIGWPLAAEQGYNAKMLVEEMGVCVEICRGVEGEISREDVKNVIEKVMSDEEMKKKACKIGELIREAVGVSEDGGKKGSSLKAMDDFVSTLVSNKQVHATSCITISHTA